MTIFIAKFRFFNQINPWEEKYACWTTYLDNKTWKKLFSVHFRAICFLPSFCEADTRTPHNTTNFKTSENTRSWESHTTYEKPLIWDLMSSGFGEGGGAFNGGAVWGGGAVVESLIFPKSGDVSHCPPTIYSLHEVQVVSDDITRRHNVLLKVILLRSYHLSSLVGCSDYIHCWV